MDSARWDLAQDLFASALPLPPADRDRLLSASGADAGTIDVVQEMLEADDSGGSLLDRSVQHLASEMLISSESIKTPSMQEFGAYRLLRLLGEGGMGVVWLAVRSDTQAQVAVKFLPGAWLSPARRLRFMQEVRLLAKLRHAGIACLYDAGTLPDGTPWFAMEYVDGQSFAAYSSNLNSLKDLLQLFCAVCEAVQHAHGKGIIHRDLKPSNLLVESNGTPKLLDFGIASELDRASSPSGLTALGMRFASPPYSAPEYVQDGTATAMSDVYSLGVMLYERLTGDSLTTSESVTSNANDAITECRPSLAARSSLNSHSMDRAAFTTSWQGALAKITRSEWNDLDVLCLKATHHDPARRYPSVEALARDVQHFLRQEPLEARPDTWTYRSAKFLRRNTFAVVSAIATLCVLLAMATVFTVRLARARTEALAQAERATRVQQFMLGLFANSGKPTDAPGNLTVETLLDRGAVEVETLHQNPALQADLNRMLGDMYSDLGKPAKAETGYAQALTFAESQPGTSIASLVDLRLQLAKVFTHENKIPQAHELGRVHTIG